MSKIVKGPELKEHFSARTLGELFFTGASKYGEKNCQIDATTDKKETFNSVKQRTVRMAIHLAKKQILTSDVVAFCTRNSLDNLIPVIATFYLGAKVASLDPTLSSRHCRHLLSVLEPKIIFVESSSVKLIEESLETTTLGPEIIVFGSREFQELLKPDPEEDLFRPLKVDENDIALLLFSSGTTGLPKPICHSHRNFLQIINAHYFPLPNDSIILHFNSLYWIAPVTLLCRVFIDGHCRIFNHEMLAKSILEIIEKYKVTYIVTVPIITYELTNFEDKTKFDVSSLRCIFIGGTPLSAQQFLRVQTLFSNATIHYGYGMSECGSIMKHNSDIHPELIKNKLGSCGKLVPGVTVKIVDPDNEKILSANEKGEIRVKSPSVMVGYYKSSNSDVFDSEGFLKTGDIGYFDEEECFYVTDRLKEMFKYRCWHIVPSAIESVLMEHPAVKEAVVFGVPEDEVDYLPAACVVLKENSSATENDIKEFVAQRVSDVERLRGGVFFMEGLPKTPSGKLSRKEVEALVLGQKKYV